MIAREMMRAVDGKRGLAVSEGRGIFDQTEKGNHHELNSTINAYTIDQTHETPSSRPHAKSSDPNRTEREMILLAFVE